MGEELVWSGARLTGHRRRLRISQKDLAERLVVTPAMVRRYEKANAGADMPSWATIPSGQRWRQVARVLNVPIAELSRKHKDPFDDLTDALCWRPDEPLPASPDVRDADVHLDDGGDAGSDADTRPIDEVGPVPPLSDPVRPDDRGASD